MKGTYVIKRGDLVVASFNSKYKMINFFIELPFLHLIEDATGDGYSGALGQLGQAFYTNVSFTTDDVIITRFLKVKKELKLTYAEIAKIIDSNPGSIRTTVSKGIAPKWMKIMVYSTPE